MVLPLMGKQKAVSLSNELHIVIGALDGVRAVADYCVHDPLGDRPPTTTISASIVVLMERLRLLDRVVRDAIDPRALWCEENDAIPLSDMPGERDVVFKVWSDRKCARRYRRDARAARRRQRHEDERGQGDDTPSDDVE